MKLAVFSGLCDYLQISGPVTSQSLMSGVRQISTGSLKAIASYVMKQFFLKLTKTCYHTIF